MLFVIVAVTAVVSGIAMGLWILPWVTVAILSLANIALHALRAQLKKEVFVVWPVPSRTQFRRQLAQSLDPLTTFRIGRDLNEIVLGLALEEKGVWYARPFAAEMIRFSLLFLMLFSSSFTISATIDNAHVRDSLEIPRHVTHDFSRATVQNLLKTQPAIDMEDLGRLLDEAGLRAEIASVFTDLKSTELTRARVFGNRLSLYGLENNADG